MHTWVQLVVFTPEDGGGGRSRSAPLKKRCPNSLYNTSPSFSEMFQSKFDQSPYLKIKPILPINSRNHISSKNYSHPLPFRAYKMVNGVIFSTLHETNNILIRVRWKSCLPNDCLSCCFALFGAHII